MKSSMYFFGLVLICSQVHGMQMFTKNTGCFRVNAALSKSSMLKKQQLWQHSRRRFWTGSELTAPAQPAEKSKKNLQIPIDIMGSMNYTAAAGCGFSVVFDTISNGSVDIGSVAPSMAMLISLYNAVRMWSNTEKIAKAKHCLDHEGVPDADAMQKELKDHKQACKEIVSSRFDGISINLAIGVLALGSGFISKDPMATLNFILPFKHSADAFRIWLDKRWAKKVMEKIDEQKNKMATEENLRAAGLGHLLEKVEENEK